MTSPKQNGLKIEDKNKHQDTFNDDSLSYLCPYCGKTIKIGGIRCIYCNTINMIDSFFCKKCGKQIRTADGKILQKYSEIKVGFNDEPKIVYSVKIWGKDKYKFKSKDEDEDSSKRSKDVIEQFKHWTISDNRCNKCFTKIPERLLKLMRKGYKVRCEVCDHPLN